MLVNKKGISVVLFVLCAMFLIGLCSCEREEETLTWSEGVLEWSEGTQAQIKRDYAKYLNDRDISDKNTVDDISIDDYLGIYQNEAVALFIHGKEFFFTSVVEEDIAGIHFIFSDSQKLYIYHKGTFTPLKEAYKNGIISKDDVKDIYRQRMNNPNNEYITEIKRNYVRQFNHIISSGKTEEDVVIDFYFGISHGVFALCLSIDKNYSAPSVEENIDSISFTFLNSQPIYIYCDKTFIPLKEAYEKNIVSKDTIKDISSEFWLEMNGEQRNKIQEDFAKYHNDTATENDMTTSDDVYVENYLGTYKENSIALSVVYNEKYAFSNFIDDDIAGFNFHYPDTHPLYIYQQGKFIPLKEAYEGGIVSKDDVEKIHNLFEREY